MRTTVINRALFFALIALLALTMASRSLINLATQVTGILAVANGGSGTSTPSLVAGTNVTIAGSWPNQTVNSTGSGTVTTTGSPASGNLAKFSGSTSITNGDLSGDVSTSGTLATTLANTAVTPGSYTNTNVTVDSKGRVTAASNGGSSPDQIPVPASIPNVGLFLWLSADCITLSDPATCATPANGTSITAWMDRSGHGGGAVKSGGTCTFNTAQQNGQPAVTFASSCNLFHSVPYSWGGAWSVFAVFKRTAGGGPLFTTIRSGASGMPYFWAGKSSKELGVDAQGNSSLGTGTAATDTNWHQANTNCDSFSNPAFRLDRATDTTISGAACSAFTGASTSVSYGSIGTFGSEVLSMQLAELIVYTRKLSSTEITTVETYLNGKYAL